MLVHSDTTTITTLAPYISLMWSDDSELKKEGDHTPALRNLIQTSEKLNQEEKDLLLTWLEPHDCKDKTKSELLNQSNSRCQKALSSQPIDHPWTLCTLSQTICRQEKIEQDPFASNALSTLEANFGAQFQALAQELFSELTPPALTPDSTPQPPQTKTERSFDHNLVKELQAILDGPYAPALAKCKQILSQAPFTDAIPHDIHAKRTQVLERCVAIADQGIIRWCFPEEYGGIDRISDFINLYEILAHTDGSLLIKFGVHVGLFGGSIWNLGSHEQKKKYLPQVQSLELPGCFGMTETGHGSNVRDIETTAIYDQKKEEFIIHTPSIRARKDYIGNGALHAQMGTIFAQLYIDGEHHGVHAFLVPLRNKKGKALKGITFEDCGSKMGLQGIDNGRISFEQVRIPRENLLSHFAQVDADGTYHSEISSPGRRFFTMLSTLVLGRFSLSLAATNMAKKGLLICSRYVHRRPQFGPSDRPEVPLIRHQTMRIKIASSTASVYAMHFASRRLQNFFLDPAKDELKMRKMENLAAGYKAWITQRALDILRECRESTGGQGYLSENRLDQLINDAEIFITFEGANVVLYQLVSKGLLTQFKDLFANLNFMGLLKYFGDQASQAIIKQNPISKRLTTKKHLLDFDFHMEAFKYRETLLLTKVAKRLKKLLTSGVQPFQAFNECQVHLVNTAQANVERLILADFQEAVRDTQEPTAKKALTKWCQLFALERLYQDRGFFLETDYIEGVKSKAIRNLYFTLCDEMCEQQQEAVEAFGIPQELMASNIARKDFPF